MYYHQILDSIEGIKGEPSPVLSIFTAVNMLASIAISICTEIRKRKEKEEDLSRTQMRIAINLAGTFDTEAVAGQ